MERFDYETSADLLSGRIVSADKLKAFVLDSRWTYDSEKHWLRLIEDLRHELLNREAEIELLKNSLLEAEADVAMPETSLIRRP